MWSLGEPLSYLLWPPSPSQPFVLLLNDGAEEGLGCGSVVPILVLFGCLALGLTSDLHQEGLPEVGRPLLVKVACGWLTPEGPEFISTGMP